MSNMTISFMKVGLYFFRTTTFKENLQTFKYSLPHFALLIFLFVYVIVGGAIFYVVEHDTEIVDRNAKLATLQREHISFAKMAKYTCKMANNGHEQSYNELMMINLEKLIKVWENEFLNSAGHLSMNDVKNGKLISNDSERWNFGDSVIYAFGTITTIGNGNLYPSTSSGRIFSIFFALFGIPLTIITIANIGKFIAATICYLLRCIEFPNLRCNRTTGYQQPQPITENSWISFLIVFLLLSFYIIVGAGCISHWENIAFSNAVYMTFITIFTVGLGDVIPREHGYLFAIFLYITLDLAILSMLIAMTAIILRKLHYMFGIPVLSKNCPIWFGNKMVTVGELARVMGQYCGLQYSELQSVIDDMDDIVKAAIAKKEGIPFDPSELGTLDLKPRGGLMMFSIAQDSIPFMDDKSLASAFHPIRAKSASGYFAHDSVMV